MLVATSICGEQAYIYFIARVNFKSFELAGTVQRGWGFCPFDRSPMEHVPLRLMLRLAIK